MEKSLAVDREVCRCYRTKILERMPEAGQRFIETGLAPRCDTFSLTFNKCSLVVAQCETSVVHTTGPNLGVLTER
jgi:hypothetical protein